MRNFDNATKLYDYAIIILILSLDKFFIFTLFQIGIFQSLI